MSVIYDIDGNGKFVVDVFPGYSMSLLLFVDHNLSHYVLHHMSSSYIH